MASEKLWLLWMVMGMVAARGAAIENGCVIPAWVDAYGAPRVNVSLSFLATPVLSGQLLRRNLTQTRPHVSLLVPPPLADSFLTLALVDPDAPSPSSPIRSSILHWIVSNIPSANLSKQEIWELGVENVPYRGPAPPNGTHRYYALVFEQKEKIQVDPINNRTNFSVREFTQRYNLYYPIGGTFFRVRANTTVN